MSRTIHILAMVLLLAGCGGEDPPPPSDDPGLGREVRLAAQGEGYLVRAEEAAAGEPDVARLEEALGLFERAIEAFGRIPLSEVPSGALWRAYRGRAETLMRLSRFDVAAEAAREAISFAPTEADSRRLELDGLRARAEVELAAGDFPEAIRLLERGAALEPEHRGARSRLAAARMTWYLLLKQKLVHAGDVAEAFRARFGESIAPGDVHTVSFGVYDLARHALLGGRPEEAFDALKQGVDALRGIEAQAGTPAFRERGYHVVLGHFMNLTGIVLIELGRYELAGKAFQAAVETDEGNEIAAANARLLGL